MRVKIHHTYRDIIAICDTDLLGKKFEEGKMQIDVKLSFFDGDEKNESEVSQIMKNGKVEDATFNIVGKKSVELAIKNDIIDSNAVIKVQNIPVALVLL